MIMMTTDCTLSWRREQSTTKMAINSANSTVPGHSAITAVSKNMHYATTFCGHLCNKICKNKQINPAQEDVKCTFKKFQ